MRIAVMGTGGVGGYFGAKLALGGNDVTFVARGRHLEAIRRDGPSCRKRVHADARSGSEGDRRSGVDRPGRCGDVLRQAVGRRNGRGNDPPLLGNGGVAIPFQNGIDSPGVLSRVLGAEHVIGGIAYIAASIASPGVVRHVGTMARLRVGAFDGVRSDAADAFVEAATAAGVEIALAPDIRRGLWEKFVFLSALSGATCLTRQPLGVIRADPRDAQHVRGDHARDLERRPRARAWRLRTTSWRSSSRSAIRCPTRCARRCCTTSSPATGSKRRGCAGRSCGSDAKRAFRRR